MWWGERDGVYGLGVGMDVWDQCRDGCMGWVYGLV